MPFRLIESSSDIVAEATGADGGRALVDLARAFTQVTTGSAPPASETERPIDVAARGDAARIPFAFVNELIFLFTTEGFLPTGGRLDVVGDAQTRRVTGTLEGVVFDPQRHGFGTEVKAATLHEAVWESRPGQVRARVLLDL